MHCEIIYRHFNAFFFWNTTEKNLKSVFWAPEFGHPNRYTSLPNDLNASLNGFIKSIFILVSVMHRNWNYDAFFQKKDRVKAEHFGLVVIVHMWLASFIYGWHRSYMVVIVRIWLTSFVYGWYHLYRSFVYGWHRLYRKSLSTVFRCLLIPCLMMMWWLHNVQCFFEIWHRCPAKRGTRATLVTLKLNDFYCPLNDFLIAAQMSSVSWF